MSTLRMSPCPYCDSTVLNLHFEGCQRPKEEVPVEQAAPIKEPEGPSIEPMSQIVSREVPPPISIDDPSKPVPQLNRPMDDPTGEKLAAKIRDIAIDPEPLDPLLTILSKVRNVEEKKVKLFRSKDQFKEYSLGWFAHFEGSFESIYIGPTGLDIKIGDEVEIVIRRRAT